MNIIEKISKESSEFKIVIQIFIFSALATLAVSRIPHSNRKRTGGYDGKSVSQFKALLNRRYIYGKIHLTLFLAAIVLFCMSVNPITIEYLYSMPSELIRLLKEIDSFTFGLER